MSSISLNNANHLFLCVIPSTRLTGTSSQLYYHVVPGEATSEFSFAICTYKQLNLIH